MLRGMRAPHAWPDLCCDALQLSELASPLAPPSLWPYHSAPMLAAMFGTRPHVEWSCATLFFLNLWRSPPSCAATWSGW